MKINFSKVELIMANAGLTAVKLAELSGVSRQNISTIKLRGTCHPMTAAKLARGLGCGVADIIAAEEDK